MGDTLVKLLLDPGVDDQLRQGILAIDRQQARALALGGHGARRTAQVEVDLPIAPGVQLSLIHISAVVGAKNMPPAYFLHAPTPHIGAATVEAQKRIGQELSLIHI